MSLILISLVILALTVIYYYLKGKYSYWNKRNVPTLEPSWLMGNLTGVGRNIHMANRFQEVYNKFKKSHQFAGFYFLVSPACVPVDLNLIKIILIKDFHAFHNHGFYYNEEVDPLSGHLFALDGEKWKVMRNKLSPTFTSGKMKMMFPTIVDTTKDLKTILDQHADTKTPVEIKNLFARFAADVIGSTAFGLDCNCLKQPENNNLLEFGEKILKIKSMTQRIKFFFQIVFPELARKMKMRVIEKEASDYIMNLIRETVDYRLTNKTNRNDFLNLLIKIFKDGTVQGESGDEQVGKITFNELAAQAFVFFFAGFETTSTTIGFALYEIARNHEVQEKARKNIRDVLKKHDGKMTYEAIMEMDYVGWIINESLRKYPVAHVLFRKATEDYQMPDSDTIIEKGTLVIVPVYGIHHDPEFYPNPEIFDPERFTPENIRTRPQLSYIPFGEGPRICIGNRFALLQLRIAMATILHSYKVTVNKKTREPMQIDNSDVNLNVLGGIWLNVENVS